MQDLTWFPFSVIATLSFGIVMAFYKFPAAKKQCRYATSFWHLFTAFMLSLVVFYNFIPLTNATVIFYGFLWGLAFLCLALLQMKALEKLDTNELYPVTTSMSLVASVLFGILFFKDNISWLQFLGIILVMIVIYSFSYKSKKLQYSKEILVIGLGIVFLSAFGKIIQKFAVESVDFHVLQIYQYLFATFFSLIFYVIIRRKKFKKYIFSGSFFVGLTIGVFSFLGGYMWLLALTKGPFSLVVSIHSLYIIITAVIAYYLFKEKITLRKIFLILIAVIAMILIRVG